MRQNLFSLFCLFAGLSISVGYVCSDTVLSQSYTCTDPGSSHLLDPSLFHGSSGQTALSITFNVRVNSLCGLASTDLPHLAVVTVTSSDGIERRIFDFQLNPANQYLVGTSEAITGLNCVTYADYAYTNLNDWMTIVGSVDLSTGAIRMGGWLSINSFGVTSGTKYRPGPWQFDSSLKIYLCSDIGGATPFSCDISQLKVVYTAYTYGTRLLFGSTPVLIADYRLEEGTGDSTENSLDATQIAYFGAATASAADTTNSSPTWTSPLHDTQYLNVPVFTLLPFDGRPSTLSVNIIVWIKVSSFPPAGYRYVYRYSSSDLSIDRFSIRLTSAGKIACTYGSAMSTSRSALSTSTWTMVAARFTYLATTIEYNAYISINFGSTSVVQGYVSVGFPPTFASSDVTRLGGFVGEVGNLEIFTPGVQIVNNPSCGIGCNLDIGNLNPPYCIYPIQCPTAQYADEFVCNPCPTGCTGCTSSSSCYACENGYGLNNSLCSPCPSAYYETVNNQCVLTSCPSGQYLNNSQCLACNSPCSGTATSCTSCIDGYTQQGSTCIQVSESSSKFPSSCPSGQYIDNSQCQNCQSPCATCSGTAISCTSCIDGYFQQGPTCIQVSESSSSSKFPLTVKIVGIIAILVFGYALIRYIRRRKARAITTQVNANNMKTVSKYQPLENASSLPPIELQSS